MCWEKVIETETTNRLNETHAWMWEQLLWAGVVLMIQTAADSCGAALWRSWTLSLPSHKGGCTSVLIGKLTHQIASALGEAWDTKPPSSSDVWTILSSPVCMCVCVFWTVSSSESWDKQCWESPCFRKKWRPSRRRSPSSVWVWEISRYQEFAGSSLLIFLLEIKDFYSLSQSCRFRTSKWVHSH